MPKSNLLFSGQTVVQIVIDMNDLICEYSLAWSVLGLISDNIFTTVNRLFKSFISLILVMSQCAIPQDDATHISTPTGSALCVMHHAAQDKLDVVHFV